MKIYAKTENGEKREVKAIYKCVDGKPVELKEGSSEYLSAVQEGERQGVISYGT